MRLRSVCLSWSMGLLLACGDQSAPAQPGAFVQAPAQPNMLPAVAQPAARFDSAAVGGAMATIAAAVPSALGAAGTGAQPSPGAMLAPMMGSTVMPPPAALAGAAGSAAPVFSVGPSGIIKDSATGELIFRTAEVEIASGEEAYLCFAASLDQKAVIDGFARGAQPFVHHMQFVKTFAPEPEGISVCKEQFKLTWLPIFLAGAGASELRFDEGVGHVLDAGTQLVVQLHLLNVTDKPIKQQVEIRMHESKSPNPTPVSPWAIGSSEIKLAPMQAGTAQNVCTVEGPVKILAVFPHMHTLGKRMEIEIGKSLDAMRPLYSRNPYDFDDQRMEKVDLSLEAGDILRVTCDWMNTSSNEVGFGESTNDEMCFFVGFALGEAPGATNCPNLWENLFAL